MWAPHGEDVWYIGPEMEHHIYNKAYTPNKREEKIPDTVEFSPKQFNMPQISSTDATFHAAHDLIYELKNPATEISLVRLGNRHKEALRTTAEIFIK